jgi:hypothetical protein
MKAQKQKRINLYSVKGASRFDQSIQSKIKKAQGMKLGRLTAPAKRKLDPYRPEIENLLVNGSTQRLSLVATIQPRPTFTSTD